MRNPIAFILFGELYSNIYKAFSGVDLLLIPLSSEQIRR